MGARGYFFVFTFFSFLIASAAFGQVAGHNVNMVSGTQWPTGDPFLQRQNEPSMAVSSRNPLHLFAGANDYRTVDLPGILDGEPTGDAWLGIFKSFDGGQTWISNLIPGYPQDQSQTGLASPIKGMQAGADATVRQGTNGMFYYSGLGFMRGTYQSKVFVARYIDDNNNEGGDTIRYIGTAVVDSSTGHHFIDKPSLTVDIPRAGAGTCSIPGTAATSTAPAIPVQTFAAGNIYIAYTNFVGQTGSTNTQLEFTRSTDCGATWAGPHMLSQTLRTNQGATLAVDPRNGTLYVAWRQFAANGQPDSIVMTSSTDGGVTFPLFTLVANITPFDQGDTATSFRTNAYPTMAVDGSGTVYIAWADRGVPGGDARIVVATSSNGGMTWNAPAAVDPNPPRGHQVMPAIAAVGGKITLAYYDLRDDWKTGIFLGPDTNGLYTETATVAPSVAALYSNAGPFSTYIDDGGLARRHTIDVRGVQFDAGNLASVKTFRVSNYLVGSRPGSMVIEQLQVDPPNFPLFKQGTVPFIGDYIDVAGSSIAPDGSGAWKFNTVSSDSPVANVVWTDNRDVRPPPGPNFDWTQYTPVGLTGSGVSLFDPTQTRPACVVGQAGMRNQNIYTARVTKGLTVGTLGNFKQLGLQPGSTNGTLMQRGFSVIAQNATDQLRTYLFTIGAQPVGGRASFLQFPVSGYPDPDTQLVVSISPQSTVSRAVFVTSTDPHASVPVSVVEWNATTDPPAPVTGGQQGSTLINGDITNPNISNPNISNPNISNPDIANAEIYNPNISNPNISNPNISNPNISNPNISNPNISNPNISNPDIADPNISNPNISNPNISNPNISNPNISNSDLQNGAVADTTWTVTNQGNTTANYHAKLYSSNPPTGLKSQLIVSRTYKTLVEVNCELKEQTEFVPVVNVVSPAFLAPGTVSTVPDALNGDPANATLALQPGDSALVTLRLVSPLGPVTYDAASEVAPAIIAQAANTGTNTPPSSIFGFIGGYQMQNWTAIASNGGATSITPPTGSTASAAFAYNINLGNPAGGVSFRTWSFQTTAVNNGVATFHWHYTGFHAYYAVTALLQAFSGGQNPATITLYNPPQQNCCTSPSAGFDVQGDGMISVSKGAPFGFIVGGSNGDSNSQLNGTLTISSFSAP